MTLYASLDQKSPIMEVPQPLLLNGWKRRLESLEIWAIEIEFDRLIRTKKSGEIFTASWLPSELCSFGRYEWDDSPFMKIWDKACQRDARQTRWCFGLLLWEHMMRWPEAWRVQQGELEDVPVVGTRCFRCRSREGEATSRPLLASTH